MQVAVVTEGDPDRVSGGAIYHRRVADLAGDNGATVRFVSVPTRPFPLAVVDGPSVMRRATAGADVVVVDSLASNTLGPWLALGAGRRTPLVGSVHQDLGGVDTAPVRRAVQRQFDRLAWRRAIRLVVPSPHLADQLTAGGLPPAKLAVVQPGRDVPVGPVPGPLDLRRGRSVALLCVGNWLVRKGIVDVLDAVADLPEELVTLHLVGDGGGDTAYRRQVLERLARPDLAERVIDHGVVAPAAVASLYAAADVFVLASTSEPYGMVYGEAMSYGLPVVGWDAGNLPHLVTDRVEGRIAPCGDRVALSKALAELATDEGLRRRLGTAALGRAAGFPTWDDTARRFFAVCRDALADRR